MGLTIVKYIQRKCKSVAKAIMHRATRKRLFEYLVFHFPICLCLMIFVIVSIVVILLTHVLVVNNSKQNRGLKTNSMVVKVYSHKTDTIIHTLPPERKENTPKELLEMSKKTHRIERIVSSLTSEVRELKKTIQLIEKDSLCFTKSEEQQ